VKPFPDRGEKKRTEKCHPYVLVFNVRDENVTVGDSVSCELAFVVILKRKISEITHSKLAFFVGFKQMINEITEVC
jgi:hypothetical protein